MISEKVYFHKLKQAIVEKLLRTYPSSPQKLQDWKGKDIANFQIHLEETVNGRISEKWIYTHLKNEADKLPRKDMLDLLSTYIGVENWDAFIKNQETSKKQTYSLKRKIAIGITTLIILLLILFLIPKEKTCEICFVDAERQALILNSPIKFHLLKDKESPIQLHADSLSCVQFKTSDSEIKFVIKSPYYKSDTIVRSLENVRSNFKEEIRLKTNDYALMIHIFSSSKLQDWKKRRNQLDNMIAYNAQIYQIFEQDNIIMDLYSKWDFINKLTTPTKSLKNIQVIETQYYQGKIQVMRFKQMKKKQ